MDRYIRDEREFSRELMKRATEEHVVKGKNGEALEGGPLTQFLLNIQEFDQVAAKMARRAPRSQARRPAGRRRTRQEDRLRRQEKAPGPDQSHRKGQARISNPKLAFDEEHSLHELLFKNGCERRVNWALAGARGLQAPPHPAPGHRERSISRLSPIAENGDKITKDSATAL